MLDTCITLNRSHWWPSGYRGRLSDMKCTVMIWRFEFEPSWVELGVRSTFVPSRTWTKHIFFPALCLGFKHILFRRQGLGTAYNATMPSPEEAFTKEPNHTHIRTHTLSRIRCLIIPNLSITRLYDSLVKITNYNLPVSAINQWTASKTLFKGNVWVPTAFHSNA